MKPTLEGGTRRKIITGGEEENLIIQPKYTPGGVMTMKPTDRKIEVGPDVEETGLAAWPIGKHDRFGQPAQPEMSGKPGDKLTA